MRKSTLWLLALLLPVLVLGVGCGDSEDDDADGDEDIVPASIETVNVGDQIVLGFESGTEEYRVVPFWAIDEDSNIDFTLTLGEAPEGSENENEDSGPAAKQRIQQHRNGPVAISQKAYDRLQRRFAWDHKMRMEERRIRAEGKVRKQMQRKLSLRGKLSSECGDLEVVRGGECAGSFDLDFTDFENNTSTITVNVKGKGTHCSVVVDSNDDVAQADIDQIVSMFDNVIYPRDHFFYGPSEIDGKDWADADGDGLRMIVLSSKVNESGAVGLFNPNDFDTESNNADLFWVVVPDSENPLDSVFGTVAHEYLHMLVFAVKALKNDTDESLWLNESMAHTMEDCSGFGIDNIYTVAEFLNDEGFKEMSMAFSGDALAARAMGFLFLRYLYEQKGGVEYDTSDGSAVTDKGGAAFLKSLMDTDEVGFEALNTALGGDWKDHFFNYVAAIILDDLPIANEAKYSYQDPYDDPITGQQIGVCTNCTRTGADGGTVTFAGLNSEDPFEDEYEASINATGVDAFTVTGDVGTIAIDTEADEDTLQFGIIRVK